METEIHVNIPVTRIKVRYIPDITYFEIIGWNPIHLRMDIMLPRVKEPTPCIVFLTGGGFLVCPKSSYMQQRLHLAEAGFMVASIEYRTGTIGTYIEALKDIKTAIRFIRSKYDEFNILKDKVVVMGESAGGYLAVMAGLTGEKEFDTTNFPNETSEVQAVIGMYGPICIKERGLAETIFTEGIPPYYGNDAETGKQSHPFLYMDRELPPFLLMHGEKDKIVSVNETLEVYDMMRKHDIDVKKVIIQNAEHGGDHWCQPETLDIIVKFLEEKLSI